jgi:CBS domain containing-hemolysin-like protein
LQRALKLGRRSAKDLMVPRDKLQMIDVNAPWSVALEAAAASPFSRMPAYRGTRDQVIGTLRIKDLVVRYAGSGGPATIESLLRPFVRVPAHLPGDQVIAMLREKRAHQAAVVDPAGDIIGFLTIQDVLGQFLGGEVAKQ